VYKLTGSALFLIFWNMKVSKETVLWVLGITAAVGATYWLINRKNTLSNTGPGGAVGTPKPAVVAGTPVGAGNQLYTNQSNVILRSSAQTNDPTFFVFGGNVDLTIPVAGTWIGTVVAVTPDMNGAINPATGAIYNWYQLSLSSAEQANFSLPAGQMEYVREDFVTVK
jgi:hypothetical protein